MSFFEAMWNAPHVDLSKPDLIRKILLQTFTEAEADASVAAAGKEEWKKQLTSNTDKVLKQGAFGAPWFMVNSNGVEEPFFGSDRYIVPNLDDFLVADCSIRFHFMWQFLGLPWEDIRIVPKPEVREKL